MNVAIRKRAKPGDISQNGLKNQVYRDKMTDAFNKLRLALWADPNEQWRSEKLYVIEGAIKAIQKFVGGSTESKIDQARNQSKVSSAKAIDQATKKLKALLLEHCDQAHSGMNVPVLLSTAAEFIKSFTGSTTLQLSGSGPGSGPGSSPGSGAGSGSGSGPGPSPGSSTGGINTPSSVLSPTDSLDTTHFLQPSYPFSAAISDDNSISSPSHSVNRDNSRYYKSGFFRPWE